MNQPSGNAPAARRIALLIAASALAGCTTVNLPDAPKTVGATPNPHYKVGAPYKVGDRWYVPKVDREYDETGIASWYGDAFHGKLTANGEIFDKRRLSAAHKTLPLPTLVEVQNLENGRRLVLRVNDRGPFVGDRIIDLSHAAADELGFTGKGLARVRVRYLGETDVKGLAALPGEKGPAPMKVASAKSSPTSPRPTSPAPAATPVKAETDSIAALIAKETGATPSPAPQPSPTPPAAAATSAPPEIWVELAEIEDLEALKSMQLDLDKVGPVSVRPAEREGRRAQSLRIGPFIDEAIALASLTRAQAAGFGAARIVRGAGS